MYQLEHEDANLFPLAEVLYLVVGPPRSTAQDQPRSLLQREWLRYQPAFLEWPCLGQEKAFSLVLT